MRLTFDTLRQRLEERGKLWIPAGTPITLDFRMLELAGEMGEACNEAKKLDRHDMGMKGGKSDPFHLALELADVVISADLAAQHINVDLGEAIVHKFNLTSDKYNFPIKL